jgi:hypothetical protein
MADTGRLESPPGLQVEFGQRRAFETIDLKLFGLQAAALLKVVGTSPQKDVRGNRRKELSLRSCSARLNDLRKVGVGRCDEVSNESNVLPELFACDGVS